MFSSTAGQLDGTAIVLCHRWSVGWYSYSVLFHHWSVGWYSYSVLCHRWSVSGTCYIHGLVSPLEEWLHHTDHWSNNCLEFRHVWLLPAAAGPFSLEVASTDQKMSSGEYSISSYMRISKSKNSTWQSGWYSFITCNSLGTDIFYLLCCKMQWTLVVRSPAPWEHCLADYRGGCVSACNNLIISWNGRYSRLAHVDTLHYSIILNIPSKELSPVMVVVLQIPFPHLSTSTSSIFSSTLESTYFAQTLIAMMLFVI